MQKRTDVTENDVDKLLNVFGQLNSCSLWSQVEREDFTVRRFEMGYVNDIACCTLTPEAKARLLPRFPTDATAVVVKFSPPELFFEQSRLEVVANNTIISERKLSPRLLYIDEKTTINEYIPCRNYAVEDDLEESTVKQLARVLAQFHSLQPPVSKNGFIKWEAMNENLGKVPGAEAVCEKQFLTSIEADPALKAEYYEVFQDLDVVAVMSANKQAMAEVGSPHVFSHSDFNRGNRLVKEVKDDSGVTIKKEIYLVDFDYSTYNYRGYDLGRYFSNYRHTDDMFGNEGFPTDEQMGLFLNEYRQECAKVQGDHYLKLEINSLEQLIKEAKVFLLNALTIDYFFCLMMYSLNPTGEKKEYFLKSAKNRYAAFKEIKERITKDGTLN
ncbi:hypothetical protein TYRP_019857 [Tyrophagus putrescentiae]|nr:hypothetical protein TYRP_019857 [Tyrophagus putrescentiae]